MITPVGESVRAVVGVVDFRSMLVSMPVSDVSVPVWGSISVFVWAPVHDRVGVVLESLERGL